MVSPATTAKLALAAGKEVAAAINKHIANLPDHEQKQLKKFFDLITELEREKVKDPRNHDKILELKMVKESFTNTVMKGVKLDSVN